MMLNNPCNNLLDISSLTPTVCRLLNINLPLSSGIGTIHEVINVFNLTGIKLIDKVLIYSPDAIGKFLYNKYEAMFDPVIEHASIHVDLCSVFPPKTPVCYASMFTGVSPEIHGIREYRRPVIKCDTLFDALVRERKNAAIVAVTNSSMDIIFRQREIDYYSEAYDEQVTERTIMILEQGLHDFIVVYHQEYDDVLHRTTPESSAAIAALKNHIRSFNEIAVAAEKYWNSCNYLIVFAPDHGAHTDHNSGKGTHGDNIPEDMQLVHFYGINNLTTAQ